jgi:hypothetical protein
MERVDAVGGSAETTDAGSIRQKALAQDERDSVRPVEFVADLYLAGSGEQDTSGFIVQSLEMADAGMCPEDSDELRMAFEILDDLAVFLEWGWHRFAPS